MKLIKNPNLSSFKTLAAESGSIISKMTAATTYFSGAATLLTAAQTALLAYIAAEKAALKGSPAQTATKHAKANDLRAQIMLLVLYADAAAISTPDEQEEIATAAGLTLKKTPVKTAQELSVKLGIESGSVDLSTKRATGTNTYLFQKNADITNPFGWTNLPVSTRSKITVSGLPVEKRCWFRVAIISKGQVQGEWLKTIVNIVVL